jgi:hypothetical protein
MRAASVVKFAVTLFLVTFGSDSTFAQLLKNPGQIVMLELVHAQTAACPNGDFFVRNSATGNRLQAFVIPKGNVFIGTDVDWQYVSPSGAAAAGHAQTLRLFATPGSPPPPGVRIFETTITLSTVGEGGTSVAASTGAAVDAGAQLCVDVSPGPFGPPSGVQHVVVRGFLVPGLAP